MRTAISHPALRIIAVLAALDLLACAGVHQERRQEIAQPLKMDSESGQNPDGISTRAKLLFEDAVKAYDSQKKTKISDYSVLEAKFKAAGAEDPKLAEADYNLGVLAERQGKKDEAVAHYQTALKKKPMLKQAAENLAVIAQNEGRIPEAVRSYESILAAYPDDPGARARLAEIYRLGGDHDRAMEMARLALIREPRSLTAYKVMMLSYLDRKQVSMARLVALRALKIDDNDPELYHTIGLILLAENEPAKAQLQFKRATEVRPDYLPSHVMLAKAALAQENYPGAEEHLRRILQANGKNAEAHLDLGIVYKGQGQYDKALQEYALAEQINPELAVIYLNRGIILHRFKDSPEKGLDNYRKYLLMLGGAVALSAEAPVFGLMNEAEQIIQAKTDAKHAEEETKKLELAQKAQQAKMKEAEEREKHEQDLEKKKMQPVETSTRTPAGPVHKTEKPPRSRPGPAKVTQTPSKDEPKDDQL
ncbi:MAG TPA: adventurous gliding motility TPR repeat lipoprotein GltE [Myxococcaceae bacterium]|nr:adventurous gliding motility TPR repeat lipoprotein GltE [Myxococcaceae bacterium]